MKIFRDFGSVHSIRNAVVTTGSFDGVHVAHKIILDRLTRLAKEIDGETVVITFHPHPAKVLYPETAGKELRLINSEEEKIELLTRAGLDNLIIVNFTLEFSKITSSEFVRNWLLEKLHARKIVIGYNHHFGHNREGDYEKLRQMGLQYGFGVEEIPELDIHHETVSSGAVRQALKDGDIEKANSYLGHHYLVIGDMKLIPEANVNRPFPGFSVRIEEENKLLPGPGGYAVSIINGDQAYHGICLVEAGMDLKPGHIRVFLFKKDFVLSNKRAVLLFQERIRDNMQQLTGQDLTNQLLKDKLKVEALPLVKSPGS